MKKIILLIAACLSLLADGFTVGANASYSRSLVKATASYMGSSVSDDYTTRIKGYELKAGYDFGDVTMLGYYQKDSYKEGPLGEDGASSYGVEGIYTTPIDDTLDFFMGGNIGTGDLDVVPNSFGVGKAGFVDFGVRAGVQQSISDNANLEVGIKIVKRIYEDLAADGVKLEMNETQMGLFVGINFNL